MRSHTPASEEYFQNAVRVKQKKPVVNPYPKKKPTQSFSKTSSLAAVDSERLIDCGFVLYINNKLQRDTRILNVKQKVDINNPNLFQHILDTLWELFLDKLHSKSLIDQLPENSEDFVSLLQGKSCLTTQEALVYIIKKSNNRKPVQIDIVYQHQFVSPESSEYKNMSSNENTKLTKPATQSLQNNTISKSATKSKLSTSSSRKNTVSRSPAKSQIQSKSNVNKYLDIDSSNNDISSDENVIFKRPSTHSPVKKISNSEQVTVGGQWAAGGLANTMPQSGTKGLSTQLRVLGCGNHQLIKIDTDGWINAHCFVFKTFAATEIGTLKAKFQPLTLKVYSNPIVGSGSMRRALKAEVKTMENGSECIKEYVAKI
ncbi:hypothetical protein PtA15_8A284 [Puccinia triticina]|uniref:Uncharacterized protein n=1 Tax=Puccinia triticina TaxID=208348 RepID=A0ABY7CUC3_9BASI|nr:uncharacterized protein PtA15_8A284 [Puccinia triticina]WAQ87380.1 hypothetical protein PtA15_8A284 [Puccinia triticina]